MSVLSFVYRELITRPLLNGLVAIYLILPYHDLGLAIIVLTLIVRILLHSSIRQTIHSQRAMAAIQPKLRQVQERFKNDKEALGRETMALYRAQGIHPLSGFTPLLIQLPVLIGLYRLFWKGLAVTNRSLLYPFFSQFAAFNPVAFGLFDLTQPSIALALAAGASQFLQSYTMPKVPVSSSRPGDFATAMQWQARYVFPIIIAAISWSLPSALAFYWTVFNIFAMLQQQIIERSMSYGRDERTHHPNSRQDGHPG
ncbi:MAG: YidC/Oxa1 family membrane protein insertase [Candidatus Sungbacteria bacterium]|uniref:YidC/Oxa1 family membrane protein insertase n=1 Tax=Candidatus Sungiibacteriota bacterium TaxID=2750080 RepID=A0A933DSZ3_9BACT|nr:YidC/Oxa1 family membrane protein insertase [Candidatus Sungbacteria bacterium]